MLVSSALAAGMHVNTAEAPNGGCPAPEDAAHGLEGDVPPAPGSAKLADSPHSLRLIASAAVAAKPFVPATAAGGCINR
jgi:hypothetical protein